MFGIVMLLLFMLACSFLIPFWVMWTVKELFSVDWSAHYWAVWSLGAIVGLYTRTTITKKD